MVRERSADPVQLLMAVLAPRASLPSELLQSLRELAGPIDWQSEPLPFTETDYYREEMGSRLWRFFLSFERLIPPEELADIKVATNRLEESFSHEGRREVNLDPGYLDYYKLVLASCKFQGNKIHLGRGVYADLTLYYDRGWKPFPWGFPDFRAGRYDEILGEIRRLYRAKRRELGGAGERPAGPARAR